MCRLTLAAGEVLGIVGENGAGKSTLVKILAGIHRPDGGSIKLEGRPFEPHNPRDALAAGIKVVHQELSLFPDRTVAENIFSGVLPKTAVRNDPPPPIAAGHPRRAGAGRGSTSRLPPNSAACRSRSANSWRSGGRCRRRRASSSWTSRTATLTGHEVEFLMSTIRALKADGVGIIFITHHLDEVFAICDRVTVMRDGRSVDERPTAAWTEETMVQAMVNRPIDKFFPKRKIVPGPVLLDVQGLASAGRFGDVSFHVRAGEIYGLAGLVGAGRTEVLKTIFGVLPLTAGTHQGRG